MKALVSSYQKPNTTYLQGMGHTQGTPAGELRVGDTMLWNYGSATKVAGIIKETAKTMTIEEVYTDRTDEKIYVRKLLKARIVARPANELLCQSV